MGFVCVLIAAGVQAQASLASYNGAYLYVETDGDRGSAHIQGHDLHQTLEGDRGTRYLQFQFHADGSVSIRTRIESEYLPGRISYTLTYRRAT